MSNQEKKGIFIEAVRGGRETPKVAPTPTQRKDFTEGREVHRLIPTPQAPPAAPPAPPPAPAPTPKK